MCSNQNVPSDVQLTPQESCHAGVTPESSSTNRQKVVGVIGTFDGLHKGHTYLIQQARNAAKQANLPLVAFTFSPSPKEVLAPQTFKGALLDEQTGEKEQLLKVVGVDEVIVLPFNKTFAERTPADFIENVLLKNFAFEKLFVGENFTFGAHGQGTPMTLKAAIPSTEIVDLLTMQGKPVSSTSIREALLKGDILTANALLGRPYEILGIVERGNGRGAKLNFPTANIAPSAKRVLPPAGVYAGYAQTENGGRYLAAINVGTSPTFKDEVKPYIEAHLLDFDGNIYGQPLTVYFEKRLREEETFSSVEELMDTVQSNIKEVRELLGESPFLASTHTKGGEKS